MSNKIGVYEFGEKLLETKDLDPVYVLLWNARLSPSLLRRWLLAYWCFYHMGTSSWIASKRGDEYWERFETAAGSKDYPRATERRHFRGKNAAKSTEYLRSVGVEGLFKPFSGGDHSLKSVMKYVQTWVGFGPWIAFKVADMLERLSLCPIVFDASGLTLFDSPQEGAKRLWNMEGDGLPPYDSPPQNVAEWAVGRILEEVPPQKAPPGYERELGIQEAETILCKYNSYSKGRYKIGEDVEACRKGLLRFSKVKLCQKLLKAGNDLWSI